MATAFVDEQIKTHKVVVFSKTYCPYCKKAKAALDPFNPADMVVIELDEDSRMEEIQNYLQTLTGARSVPRVFIGGKFYGGGDETAKGAESGDLKKRLMECGAVA